jgi:hypothetical protein
MLQAPSFELGPLQRVKGLAQETFACAPSRAVNPCPARAEAVGYAHRIAAVFAAAAGRARCPPRCLSNHGAFTARLQPAPASPHPTYAWLYRRLQQLGSIAAVATLPPRGARRQRSVRAALRHLSTIKIGQKIRKPGNSAPRASERHSLIQFGTRASETFVVCGASRWGRHSFCIIIIIFLFN